MTDFNTLALRPELLETVAAQGFDTLTPVQARAIPPILAGADVRAEAATGSGKTAAFGLGLLNTLDATQGAWQALVLCPTRELADQVAQAMRALAAAIPNVKLALLCGGAPMRAQASALAQAPHIVVATPGRLLAHLRRANLDAHALRTVVLDEADRMLDMGFIDDIRAILSFLPEPRQTLLFSATWPADIETISAQLQHAPVEIRVANGGESAPRISQVFHQVEPRQKMDVLARLLLDPKLDNTAQTLVFCNKKVDVDAVTADLTRRGFSALALHGDREQYERDEVLLRFAQGSAVVLVATDVAARGLDIADLAQVISYDPAANVETHTHRIGRTGRAGRSGRAICLCTPRETHRAEQIAVHFGFRLAWARLPTETRTRPAPPPMTTLMIRGGKRDKLRPGDILGALTGDDGLAGSQVGRIDLTPVRAYVAVARETRGAALERIKRDGIKGRRFRVSALDR